MQRFKFSDVLFFRVVPESSDLKFLEIDGHKQLNLLQFAVAHGQEDLVRYILSDHKYTSTATRQLKTLDSRIILASEDEDETLTLRLALSYP